MSAVSKFREKRHFIREGEVDRYLCRYVVDLITSEEVGGIQFAVFLDEDLGIQWYARDQYGVCHESRVFADNFETILNNVVHLETLSASLRRQHLSPRPRVETIRKVHQRIAEVSQQVAEREAKVPDGGGQKPPVNSSVTTAAVGSKEPRPPTNVDDDVLYELRSANPELRATRRLIAESLARTYVLSYEAKMEDHRVRAAAVAANAGEGLDAGARAKLRADLAALSMEAETELKVTHGASRERAAKAAEECLEMARKYLHARSTDFGRQNVLLGALAALVLMTAALVFSFSDYYSSTKVSVQSHVAEQIANVRTALADANNSPEATTELKESLRKLEERRKELDTPGKALRPVVLEWLEFEATGLREQIKAPALPDEKKKSLQQTLDILDKQRAEILEKPKNSWINADGMNILASSAIGALGAMLSLLMSAASRPYDAGAGRLIHWLEGITRIVVGVLGACFITLGLQSGFFLGFLKDGSTITTQKFFYLQLLLGFTAGLSERLVPSFITIVEAQVQSSGGSATETKKGDGK